MCNDAIRIAVKGKPRSRFTLIEIAYPRLKEYGLHTHYILSACEVAYSVYRNKERRSTDPYIERAFLKLDNQSYSLNHLLLRIPTTPRHFIYLTLQGSNYHLSFIDDPSLKRGSITLTGRTVSIAFSKETAKMETLGEVGIDVNERNCDSPLIKLEGRRVVCPSCRHGGDRDVIASRNIMAALVRAARPSKGSREGEPRRQEKASNPRSRWMEVSVGDGPKS